MGWTSDPAGGEIGVSRAGNEYLFINARYSASQLKLQVASTDRIVITTSTITLSNDTALAAGKDLETSTTGKVKQKGAFMQNSVHQSWVMGG